MRAQIRSVGDEWYLWSKSRCFHGFRDELCCHNVRQSKLLMNNIPPQVVQPATGILSVGRRKDTEAKVTEILPIFQPTVHFNFTRVHSLHHDG